jgi:UDP-N-acetylmuramoyl-tripeptide--D-alanyl-D-alanine ligase
MRKILQLKLKIAAQLILRKYKPVVIGITGSIGKSSTKEAVFHVLKNKLNVRTSFKNYNNEIGLPLSIIGCVSPGKNIYAWLGVILKIISLLLIKDKHYPQVLILEMGVDRPGDMEYLT